MSVILGKKAEIFIIYCANSGCGGVGDGRGGGGDGGDVHGVDGIVPDVQGPRV